MTGSVSKERITLAWRIRWLAENRPMSATTRTALEKVANEVEVMECDMAAMIRIMRTDMCEQLRAAGLERAANELEERARG